jgi:RNA polymerase sigma-32 factor
MNRRLSGVDASLNATISVDGEGSTQWQDWLEDESSDQASDYAERNEFESRKELLTQAMSDLNDREIDILTRRRLAEKTSTLEELSLDYKISRERVRQIEVRAFEKLQSRMQVLAHDKGMI